MDSELSKLKTKKIKYFNQIKDLDKFLDKLVEKIDSKQHKI
jgi:peptidoglycan hydrolase CwlO-like protein